MLDPCSEPTPAGAPIRFPGARSVARRLPPGERLREMVRFGIVGLGNFCLDLGLFALLHYACGIEPVVANTISYSLAVVSAFLCHRYWTFAGHTPSRPVPLQLALFFGCNAVGLILSNLTVWTLSPLITPAGAKLASLGVTYCWNYWSNRRFVFVPAAVAGGGKTG